MHSGFVRLVLLALNDQVVSFRTQNKIVLVSVVPPLRLTLAFFTAPARTDLF